MKFWNKQPNVRARCWTKISLPQEDHHGMYPNGVQTFYGWFQRRPFEELKQKLQNNPSKGKFYMMILNKDIWFERGVDATWFILQCGME
jgi:hypothetical protein